MYTLSKGAFHAVFDEAARLVSLVNEACSPDNVILEPSAFGFKMVVECGECKECVCLSGDVKPKITASEDKIEFAYGSLTVFDGRHRTELPIELRLNVTICDDKLVFGAAIDNRSEGRILDFAYPNIGKIASLQGKSPALLYPVQSGIRIQNIGRVLGAQGASRENGGSSMSQVYPGGASMNWLALTVDTATLFARSQDPMFYPTELRIQGEPGRNVSTLMFSRNLCLAGGKSMTVAETVVDYYAGDWHRGADDYATWMKPYRPEHVKPDWVRDMRGYFLVINKQQYGCEMWPYDTLPELYRLAKSHGFDTLGLFGWYHSGHDNQYPDLEVSPTLGGEEVLKRNIKEVQAAGGHVTLYYQGHLIDETSKYYREGDGRHTCCKNIWGSPYVEFYNKSHQSDFLKDFSHKMFTIACPSCASWRELMKERQDWLAELGPDGCLYDQIGGILPYICFDETHEHENDCPALSMTQGRRKLLGTLQTHAKEIKDTFAFCSEHIVDLYSAYLDLVHGIGVSPSGQGSYAAAETDSEAPRGLNYPGLFRYCFPETVVTVRNPAPHYNPRLAKYALTFGLRPELELRYQADCDDIKADAYREWREVALQVAALRDRYAEQLLRGVYRDTCDIVSKPAGVIATSFVNGDTMACVLWNDTTEAKPLDSFAVSEGWTLAEASTFAGCATALPEALEGDGIAVVLYRKG